MIVKLDSISGISYSVESEKHQIKEGEKTKNIEKVIFSELIEIKEKNYLLKIYSNDTFNMSELTISFFKIHAVITFVVTIGIGFMLETMIVNPLRKILFEIKDYKFGKKSKKSQIRNEIDIIQNEFVALTDALDKEKKEQNRIIASVSHHLKTPLTSVIGYSNLMLNENMTKEQMIKYNGKINSKSKNMKDILNNFDEYLVDNTYNNLKYETIKVKDLLDQLNADYHFDLQASNIEFIIQSDCIHKSIQIDIRKIRRIFSNIIYNSVHHIKTRGIIKIKVEEINKCYKFTISDNGKGVDESIIDKIFDPLFTKDNSIKISELGLSICKEFIEMHSGSINVYNDLGLTVEFKIPKNSLN